MRRTLLLHFAPLALLVAGCSQGVIDPVGEPYRLILQVTPPSPGSGEVQLAALVDYSPFGAVRSTVEFLNGETVLARTSAREEVEATSSEPWDFKFRQTAALQPGVEYNLTARIRWTVGETEKTLDSEVVRFRLATP